MISVDDIRALCRDNRVKWTLHALDRIRERKIKARAVMAAVRAGRIIKQYTDDKPFPSCLIFNGDSAAPLHVVVSYDGSDVHVITAYTPTLDKWEIDYETRKEPE